MKVRGKIVGGFGVGGSYVKRKEYYGFFKEMLGYEPFPGTLNVELEEELNFRSWEYYKPSKGGGIYFKLAYLKGRKILLIRPELSKHGKRVLEIIGPKLNLKPGTYVELLLA